MNAPVRRTRRSTRADGTNPRAKGTNPRAMGTNPSAGSIEDRRRLATMRRAMVLFVATYFGVRWCSNCDDTGWVYGEDGEGPWRCHDHHEPDARTVELWYGQEWPSNLKGGWPTWDGRAPESREMVRQRLKQSFPSFPQV